MALTDVERWVVECRRPPHLAEELEVFGPAAACWPEYQAWLAAQPQPVKPSKNETPDG